MIRQLLIGLAFLLTACSGRIYQNPEYVPSQFKENQKAIIVFQLRGRSTFLGAAPKVEFDLVRINKQIGVADGKYIYHFSPGFLGGLNTWDKEYICFMVEPGFYIFDNVSWSEGNAHYFTPKGALPTANPVQYGAFEVGAGTVNYLGDLEVYCRQASLAINNINRFDKAKASLEKKHPELAPHLKHVDFLPAGYCVSKLRLLPPSKTKN